jgi:DNA-binding transcriptional ArsR family regulator
MHSFPRQLNPTLWRTCRVLAGRIRLKLLRQLHDAPGQSVSDLARTVGIGVSDASQELRRLQSRGLLQAERKGARLIYRLGADPQVPSAAPLLKALVAALSSHPPDRDEAMSSIATGLAHPRRIALAAALMKSPRTIVELHRTTRIPKAPLHHHLGFLSAGGYIKNHKGTLTFRPPHHPLARALSRLVQTQ